MRTYTLPATESRSAKYSLSDKPRIPSTTENSTSTNSTSATPPETTYSALRGAGNRRTTNRAEMMIAANAAGKATTFQAPIGSVRGALHISFFLVAGLLPFLIFIRKTYRNIALTGDRPSLSNW